MENGFMATSNGFRADTIWFTQRIEDQLNEPTHGSITLWKNQYRSHSLMAREKKNRPEMREN